MDQSHIRNFCIIAHIDHGKSTLADRLLEVTGTVEKRKMMDQMLDSMDLERERGITIKLAPARMQYKEYVLNLIDTPGHVDFTYEVSRSLAAVEGAILLVDATQGVQAQTIANLYLAVEQDLTIIPVINKVDLPNAEIARTREELMQLVGCSSEDIILASGKTGEGVEAILRAVIERVPPPKGNSDGLLRALIFDSTYDEYKGVVAFVRVVDGAVGRGDKIRLLATSAHGEAIEVGVFRPARTTTDRLEAGEIGYIVTGFKEIEMVRVGDTVASGAVESLPGYREVKPMVFAGIFPKEGSDFEALRDAMLKLKLSDASLAFEPERSGALGFGFRVGLLGLLHLEIVQERLRREHGLELVVTTPSVAYKVVRTDNTELIVKSPADLPERSRIARIEEPWVALDVVAPKRFIGGVLGLAAEKRGVYRTTEYLHDRAIIKFEIPLASILVDFYDNLKSATSGYASMNYDVIGYREADIVRLDILVAEEPVEALASMIVRDEAYAVGRSVVERLKESIPKQQFEIKLQAAVGGKVIAAERIAPLRKDVLAKLSGGDATRKMKLLEKQKKGKKKMAGRGSVEIPTEAYLAVLKR